MLVAYFDESGTQAGSATVSVAGYLSDVEQWNLFEQEWKQILQREGLEYFHMSEYESRIGIYDWDNVKRVSILRELFEIIKKRTNFPISCSVITDDYPKPTTKEVTASPYTFCVIECMKAVAVWAEPVGHQELIAYVFEDGAGWRDEVEAARRYILGSQPRKRFYRLGSLTFADKKLFPQLQAADILAYESYKEMLNGIIGISLREPRLSFRALLNGCETKYCKYYNKQGLVARQPINYTS